MSGSRIAVIDTQQQHALDAVYRGTTFEVDHPEGRFGIRIGQTCARLDALLRQHAVTDWAFVTAWNPHSQSLPAVENARRHAALTTEVRASGHACFAGRGRPETGDWLPEESLLILGIAEDDALRLAAQFGQNAIVAGVLEQPAELRWCEHAN